MLPPEAMAWALAPPPEADPAIPSDGAGLPGMTERLAGNSTKGEVSCKKYPLEKPAVNVFTTLGEKVWDSCKLTT